MSRKVDLKKVSIELDEKSGYIYLKSADNRLKGKPMKITVKGGTPTYDSLLKLVKPNTSESELLQLPENLSLKSLEQLWKGSNENIDTICMGAENSGSHYWDLDTASNTLICGQMGAGNSVIMRLIELKTLTNERILHLGIDLRGINSQIEYFDDENNIARTKSKTVSMLESTLDTIHANMDWTRINEKSSIKSLEADKKIAISRIYLTIQNIDELYEKSNNKIDKEIKSKLLKILKNGMNNGVYVFAATHKIPKDFMPRKVLKTFQRKVLLGRSDNNNYAQEVLGEHQKFTGLLMHPRCRGIIQQNDEQKLVQFYFSESRPELWLEQSELLKTSKEE